jgi:xylitol oxidase
MSAANCTQQLGIPGPWLDRLPHFRNDFAPSSGEELQSEYLLPVGSAAGALQALRGLADRLAPALYISEIRTVAADGLWLSPAYGRDSVAMHLTWKPLPDLVGELLPLVEDRLAPFGARPHWGKLFGTGAARLAELYPRFPDFRALVSTHDPGGKFTNAFLGRVLGSG